MDISLVSLFLSLRNHSQTRLYQNCKSNHVFAARGGSDWVAAGKDTELCLPFWDTEPQPLR